MHSPCNESSVIQLDLTKKSMCTTSLNTPIVTAFGISQQAPALKCNPFKTMFTAIQPANIKSLLHLSDSLMLNIGYRCQEILMYKCPCRDNGCPYTRYIKILDTFRQFI